MSLSPPLRVVQWATGAVGRYSLRSVITRPEFELAGVLVYDPDKVGQDAGTLVGLPEAGVICTDDVEEILATEADCVLHMPLPASFFGGEHPSDVETICALLAAGKNVITTTGFVYPKCYGPGVVERLLQTITPIAEYTREGNLYLADMILSPFGRQDLKA